MVKNISKNITILYIGINNILNTFFGKSDTIAHGHRVLPRETNKENPTPLNYNKISSPAISFYISNVMNMCNIWPQYAKDKIGLFVCINLNQMCNSDKNFFFRRKYILNYSSVKCILSASDICFSFSTK